MLEDDSGLGLTFATNLFIGREPSSPNNCATLFDTPGRGQALGTHDFDYFYPSIQVRVRDENYLDGWDRINQIRETLHHRPREVWNGSQYEMVACVIEPALLDWDENDRARFVTTFNLQRRPNSQ